MALISYLQTTRRILKDASFARFIDGDLVDWINIGRGQVAAEGECVRVCATLVLNPPDQEYHFHDIVQVFNGPLFVAGTGVASVLNVRMMTYNIPGTSGSAIVTPREWEWFNYFVRGDADPKPGPPVYWAQMHQGVGGSFWVNIPDLPYTLFLDTVCLPIPLAAETDPEAVPSLWTDAVPYYAAYLAMLSAHEEGADNMLKLYEVFTNRARQFANPSVLPGQYSQAPDPMMAGRLGVTRAA